MEEEEAAEEVGGGSGGGGKGKGEGRQSRKESWLVQVLGFVFFFFFLSFFFQGLHPRRMDSRLGVESELQPPAYTTATTPPDLSRVCDLHHSSWQLWIPQPHGS